jgi:glucuronide carrier protein
MKTNGEQIVATKKLGLPTYLGYAAGDAGCNLAFSMFGMFLLLYYTDVAGIAAAAAGTLFLAVRAWDAFADLFSGRMVDMTSTRWGKFRPFILFGSVPLLLLSMATFSVPREWSDGWRLAYAYATYALVGLAYSLVNIPYGSMAPALTQVPEERARLAAFRSMGSALTILMLAWVVAPQIRRYVGDPAGFQQSLTFTTGIFVIVGFLLFFFTFLTCKEQVQREVASVTLKQSLETFKTNMPLMMLCGTALMAITGLTAFQTVGAYYARDVLLNANLFIWITLVNTGVIFLVAPLMPTVVHTIGKKNGYLVGGILGITGGLGITFAPSLVIALISAACMGIGVAMLNTLMWALEADTVEYGEWKTGVRTEGTTYALFSFTRKLGQAFGGAAAAFTLGLGGYIAANAGKQTESAQWAIRVAAGSVPAVLFLIAISIMFFYPLTEKKFKAMVGEVAARRAEKKASMHDEGPWWES